MKAALLLTAVLLYACLGAARPAAAPQTLPAGATSASQAALAAHVNDILTRQPLPRASVGVLVRSLDRGDALVAINDQRLLMPASVTKVVTLAVAAERLGWDYTFHTTATALGRIENGVLHGDLVVTGAGDPTLDNWDGASTARFARLAARLKQDGVSSISGRIVGDDSLFEDEAAGNGWAWDDLASSFATSISALQFNQGTAQVVLTPGEAPGAPARFTVNPPEAPVRLRNRVTTTPGGAPSLTLKGSPRSADIEVSGTIPSRAGRIVRNLSVANPTLYFVNALKRVLVREGVAVEGPAIDIDDLEAPLDRSAVRELGDIAATTLAGIAEPMMKVSQNLYAESLFETLAAHESGQGTLDGARALVAQSLTSWGIAATDFRLVDGSGLSRYNVITPAALTAVLAHVYGDERLRDTFVGMLPVAGVSGTLSNRMAGTAAARNLRAKTGSFSNARTVAGFVKTRDGEPLVFAVLVNNYNDDNARIDDLTDQILIALAGFSRQ
jgi:D-alanyl-D-alanine carboxypeptidase/D-alanyl-D-alanine-endopeptidase (penicillin-binding protein 4)